MGERPMFEKILHKFPKVKILVVGDVMMDRFIWGKVSRISPEAPVPVVLVDNRNNEDFHLGGAANVANNVHSLGGKVSLCGVVGNDENGQKIRKKLIEIGIEDSGVFTEKGRQTTVKTRVFADQQQVVRIDRETTDHPEIPTLSNLSTFLAKNIRNYDAIVISDYGKGLMTEKLIKTIFQKARRTRKKVLVDSKLKNFFLYKGANVVTPNTKEAGEALGIPITDEISLESVGGRLLERLRCNALVITRG
jgi:rfaE bifunctional protein kinase chain/domain